MDHTFMERFESVPSDWIKLEETEYLDNGVAFIEEAENLGTFVVGKIMNTNRTGAFYYFGEDSSFIELFTKNGFAYIIIDEKTAFNRKIRKKRMIKGKGGFS